jgi:hypothetical protein
MRAKEVLQDSARIPRSVPPQVWELAIGRVVCGGVHDDSTGYEGASGLTTPNLSPDDPMMIFIVDPGKYRSWYEVATSGEFGSSGVRRVRAARTSSKSWPARRLGS